MHYLYRITNNINGKVYIGQTNHLKRRWQAHRTAAKNKPEQIIHHAIKKHGTINFTFEHIATSKTWDDANETETLLVEQYQSHISTGKGYNNTRGGYNAPKTPEWIATITEKANARVEKTRAEMTAIAANRPEAYYDHFKGNTYCAGLKHTDEWKERMSERMKNRPEEELENLSIGLKKAYAEGRKVVSEIAVKKLVEWVKSAYENGTMPPPANKVDFTDEQKEAIRNDTRSAEAIGADHGCGSRPIDRIRHELGMEIAYGNTGRKHSVESREKMSKNLKGKFAGDKNPFFGKKHSPEIIEQIRQKKLGQCKFTKEQIEEMEEMTKNKISQKDIAKRFNCTPGTVWRVRKNLKAKQSLI